MNGERKFRLGASVIALVLAVVFAIYAAAQEFTGVSLKKLETADLGTLFLTLIFVALVIERAVEVFVNNQFDPEQMRIERGVREAELQLALDEEALARELAREIPRGAEVEVRDAALRGKQEAVDAARRLVKEARERLRAEKVAVIDDLAGLTARKASWAGAAATILGLIAAVAGVRILEQFLGDTGVTVESAIVKESQRGWFRFGDVLLTTLVLAGGADGIHQIVKDFLARRKDLGVGR